MTNAPDLNPADLESAEPTDSTIELDPDFDLDEELEETRGWESEEDPEDRDIPELDTSVGALDLAERFPAEQVGVTVDTYHIWWDDQAPEQIARAGAGGRIAAFQLADWITPLPADTLLARGMMGDGHIDFAAFTRSVSRAGYRGDIEVEIFNADLWAAPPAEVVDTMVERYLKLIQPYMGKDAPGALRQAQDKLVEGPATGPPQA